MMERDKLADLIRRLREGNASDEEKYQLEQFWQESRRDTSPLDSLSENERQALKRKMFKATKAKIQDIERKPAAKPNRSWFWPVAAGLCLMMGTTVLLYWNIARTIEMRTGYGERAVITLPDQSTVTLNGNTVLRYKSAWNETETREVWIEGEGFFNVQHTAGHQEFIVHALRGFKVEVLGTKFNIKSRRGETEVWLTEGKTKLEFPDTTGTTSTLVLAPGELGVVNRHQLTKQTVSRGLYTSWLSDTLTFDHTRLKEISHMLSDTYGLSVSFSDTVLQHRQLSGSISAANADDVLDAIAETFELKVRREGDRVYISPKE